MSSKVKSGITSLAGSPGALPVSRAPAGDSSRLSGRRGLLLSVPRDFSRLVLWPEVRDAGLYSCVLCRECK